MTRVQKAIALILLVDKPFFSFSFGVPIPKKKWTKKTNM